ncbi:MAG TPA: glycosyl hydrolase [Solirubrobacterales bacterium]|nr:glycosyl hydrolase [Solirubrobacterales bacterium]
MRMPRAKTTAVAALVTGLLVLLACGSVASAAAPAHRKAPPKQRPTYWGAWIGPQLTGGQPPWDMSSVARFEELSGKGPSLLSFSAPFADCTQHPCDFYDFPAHEMDVLRSYGAIPFFSWGTQAIPVPGDLNQPDFQLADIIAGDYDSYIRKFAEEAAAWGRPYFLRFNWEMNGNWFLWSEGVNGNPPGTYVAAWRHVHDIFTAAGATNTTWVWCPYADVTHKFGALAKYYPGDDAVDWTCLDGFNWANNGVNSQPWRSFDEIFASSYRTITRRIAPTKPMMLAEFASGGRSHRKAAWIDQMFTDLRTTYRRIRGVIWFEQIDRGVKWPIESSPKVTEAFRRGIGAAAFRPNQFSGLVGGPVQPPS